MERPLYFAVAVAVAVAVARAVASGYAKASALASQPSPQNRGFSPWSMPFSQPEQALSTHATKQRLSQNRAKMNQKPHKTEKNLKKPVETEEIVLTKPAERLKVNCGTVLRTRMNIDDRASFNGCFLIDRQAGQGSGPEVYFDRWKKEQYTWQRE